MGVKKSSFPYGLRGSCLCDLKKSFDGCAAASFLRCLVLFAFSCNHVDESVTCALLKFNHAVNQCVKSVILTHTNVHAWTVNSAALTADNVTGFSELTTKNFHTETLAVRLATVLRTTYTFFMCHNLLNF